MIGEPNMIGHIDDETLMMRIGPYLLVALVCGVIGILIGRSKGLWLDGLVYGGLLGPLGWLIVLLKQPTPESVVRREQEIEAARRKGR
jgi:hypothetical protein